MFCENCGKELKENSKFCTSCGTKVKEEKEVNLKKPADEIIKETKQIMESKKKNSTLPLILIILVLLGIGGYLGYKYFFASKDNIVKGLINGMYDTFEEVLDKANEYDFKKESVLVKGDLSIDSNITELKDLNGIKLNYTTGIDYKKKKMEFGLGIEEDKKELIDAMMYVLDDEAYVLLKDYYKSLIKIDSDGTEFDKIFETESKIEVDDIKYIVKTYKDALIESLDMKDFKESNDKIEIDDKEVDVKKLEYDVTLEKIDKLSKKVAKKLKEDKKFISKISDMFEVDEDDVKESLESYIDSEEYDDDTEVGKINIYVKGLNNEFAGMDITSEENKIEVRKDGNVTYVEIKSDDSKVKFVITSEEDSCVIEFKTDGFKGKINLKEEKIDNKNKKGKLEISIDVNGEKLTIKSNYKVKVGAKIADIDTDDAKAMSKLTEAEMTEISEKLMENLEDSKLYSIIVNLVGSMYNNYNYDYGTY